MISLVRQGTKCNEVGVAYILLEAQNYPLYRHVLVFLDHKCQSIALLTQSFRVTGHFEKSASNDRIMTLNTKRGQMYCSRIPSFSWFHSMASHFRVTGNFETRTPKDYTRVPILNPSCPTIRRFHNTRFWKNRNTPNNLRMTPKYVTVKTVRYIPRTYPDARSEKMEMHRVPSD